MSRGASHRAGGFTLVEMLVVIAIIGILVALLLPAVQAARESARRTQCMNNVKQLAFACLQHEAAWEFLPTGGWGWRWAGDPERGFDERQPGGWHYNILPYLERNALHDLGKNDPTNKMEAGAWRAATNIPAFMCPSRGGRARVYPYNHSTSFINIDRPHTAEQPTVYVTARSDYAACGGDNFGVTNDPGPGSLAAGDAAPQSYWDGMGGTAADATGVIFRRSKLSRTDIPDGASNTYLLGERYLCPDDYMGQLNSGCNDQGWDMAYDYDTNRWTHLDPAYRPMQDTPGYVNGYAFGSAHPVTFHMANCDGAVQPVSFDIDQNVHRAAGNRKDSRP